MTHILAIDSGTTSTRALAFTLTGEIAAVAQFPLTQHFPKPGWVEHDPTEIWTLTKQAIDEVRAQIPDIATIAITNQRETIVFWSKSSGKPLAPAIVWQDRRTADVTARLRSEGHEATVQSTTGLLLDPYFSATKIAWTLENVPAVAAAAASGDLAIGTVDSWLVWNLTDGERHITDASNASRTQLMDLSTGTWSPDMATIFKVPLAALPEIVPTSGPLAHSTLLNLPITGMAGDQQAATVGQACLAPGLVKCTYGTGIFMLANAGPRPPVSRHRLLSTWLTTGHYALEGSIFVGGNAVKWLRDGLGILDAASESEALTKSVPDNGGITFVPAFAGLGAPHWEPLARGLLTGITGGTTRAHIVRATLEAMGQQTADLLDAFISDGVVPTAIKVDGGMVANTWLCQDIANATGLPVERPRCIETTGLGAAMLAAVGADLFPSLETAAAAMVHSDIRFEPIQSAETRKTRRDCWKRAVAQTIAGLTLSANPASPQP